MVEFAPTPVIIVKFRTEKEMRISFRKILLDNRCTQRRSWTSVSVSVHESWARIPSIVFFKQSNKPGYPRQVCPELAPRL